MKLETFDAALDEFYSKIESQKVEQQHRAKEGSAVLKLDKIRSDQVRASLSNHSTRLYEYLTVLDL